MEQTINDSRHLWSHQRPFSWSRQPFLSLAVAAAIGIVAQRSLLWLDINWGLVTLAGLWLGCGLLGWLLLRYGRRGWPLHWGLCLLAVAATSFQISYWDEQRFQSSTIAPWIADDPQPVIVQGTVATLVERIVRLESSTYGGRERSPIQTRFELQLTAVRLQQQMQPCSGRLWVQVEGDVPAVGAGDAVQLAGELSGFSLPRNPGQRDLRGYARNRGLHGRLFVRSDGQLQRLAAARWGVWRAADQIARRGEAVLHQVLGVEKGALAAALVVGRRGSLAAELEDQLMVTGTIHMLSVSGMHMGIVAVVFRAVGVALGLRTVGLILFVGSLSVLFVLVTGAKPPILRSAILVGVVLAAASCRRQPSPLNSLGLAALLLMLMNPTDLTQVGVQLSFLAVATLFGCGQRYQAIEDEWKTEQALERLADAARPEWAQRLRRWRGWLDNALWYSLCVTLTTGPLIWYHFHVLSPVSVLANVLLAGPMTIALVSGLVAVAVGLVAPWLAYPCGWICWVALAALQWLLAWPASLPAGHFWLPAPPLFWVVLYYVVLALAVFWPRCRSGRVFLAGSLLWTLLGVALAISPAWLRPPQLTATFVDVGHGTCVIINLPDGRNWLYDCGSMGNWDYHAEGFQEPLWYQGLTRLDAVVLSHADADHFNALPGLLARFRIDELIVPRGMLDVDKPGLVPLRAAIARAGVAVREVSTDQPLLPIGAGGDEQPSRDRPLRAADWRIGIRHPPPRRVAGNDNANSLVLVIEPLAAGPLAANSSAAGPAATDLSASPPAVGLTPRILPPLILPGDLESPGMELVVNQPRPRPGGVLMAPHHGSLTLDASMILDWARPSDVIVSGGKNAARPAVAEALQVRGSRVHVTAHSGAIRVDYPVTDRLPSPDEGSQPTVTIRGWLDDGW